ncbi:hypothetical protein V6Z11_A08G126700 [Gossypium hirsutum]
MNNISTLSLKEQDKGVYRKSRNAIQTRLQMAMEVRDSLEIAHIAEDFSKLYTGIAILLLHLSLNQPSVVYFFFFFSDLFPLINES